MHTDELEAPSAEEAPRVNKYGLPDHSGNPHKDRIVGIVVCCVFFLCIILAVCASVL